MYFALDNDKIKGKLFYIQYIKCLIKEESIFIKKKKKLGIKYSNRSIK